MKIHKGKIVHRGSAPTRALTRCLKSTRLAMIPVEPAATTPAQVITDFFIEHWIEAGDGWAAELSSRIHRDGVISFDDDGAVVASYVCETLKAIGQAIERQADLIAKNRWPDRNKLRLLVQRYERELSMVLIQFGMGRQQGKTMEQNAHGKGFRLRTRPQTQECILLWLDEFGLHDADDEAIACLVKRLDTLDAPFDHDPERIEAFIGDLIEWVSATVDGHGQKVLLEASATLSEAFLEAGVIEEARCVAPKASQEADDVQPVTGANDGANSEANFRPMRRDLIYTSPVEIELVDGSCGSVLHPPFDGRVKMKAARGRSQIVPLDDVTDDSLRALKSGSVRRRVEVHSRCSVPSCSQAIRLYLSENQNVESIDGERECGIADLFCGRCPKHRRAK